MRHIVLFKLKKDTPVSSLLEDFQETYRSLEKECPFLTNIHILKNCYERETNSDFAVELDVASPDLLTSYINHPLHVALIQRTRSHFEQVNSFDYELI